MVTDEEQNLSLMGEVDKYADWQFEQLRPYLKGDVLEVGAGIGTMTGRILLLPGIVSCSVTEINPNNLAVLKRKFPSACRFMADADLEKTPDPRFMSAFDTVLSVNVMEHVEDDRLFFRNCCKCLRPDGNIIKLVPAKKSLFGTVDEADNHYRRYEPGDLRELANENKLEVSKLSYFNLIGAFGWFYHGKILKTRVHGKGDLKFFNAMVPILKLEKLVPLPFGLSLLMVARKQP